MSIRVAVPLDALQQPGVAKALADLMLNLGGLTETDAAPKRRTPPSRTKARRGPAQAPRAPAKAASTGDDDGWTSYVDALPDPSRRFLVLLAKRGTLTIDEAVSELGLKSAKAMGGLTGAMTRWAPKHGVELPFEKSTNEHGRRCWTWTRG